MILHDHASLCVKNQKIIVSSENKKRHIANNPNGRFDVRQYQLDGVIVKNRSCCDYLLVNDSVNKAYYIELKGCDVKKAVTQVLAGEKLCRDDLKDYTSYYRIVSSKVSTHDIKSKVFRNLKESVGRDRFVCEENVIDETLN